MSKPRIAIPIPTSFDPEYNERSWPQYAKAVERSGGEPVAVPLGDAAAAAELAKTCDGVLLPGSGADVEPAKFGQKRDPNAAAADAQREEVDTLLLETAEQQSKPVLAICFGTQMLNVWRGGSLIQHLPEAPVSHRQRGVVEAHSAEVAAGSLLASAAGLNGGPNRIAVNSSHHQAIESAGNDLRVVAKSSEDGVIEAIEDTSGKQFLLGVQWHPERTYDESAQSKAIFDRFIAEASGRLSKSSE
jgi:putative glutamine amidotransferase